MAIITEELGDIFSAPSQSILIHACNARGAWGSGVALAFKKKYPLAFRKYNAHCLSSPTGSNIPIKQHQTNLVGTTLLIAPPSATDQRQAFRTPHYIACLFTSLDYGKRVSPPKEILENTGNALKDLAKQVAELRGRGEDVGNCYAVRINSGKFAVGWQMTEAVLEAGDLDITVVRPEEEENADGTGTAAGGKRGQRPTMSSEAKGSKPPKAAVKRAGGSPDKHMVGVKRKLGTDIDENDGSDGDNTATKQAPRLQPGIAKRRKKLGLDG